MRRLIIGSALVLGFVVLLLAPLATGAHKLDRSFKAKLTGAQEVPPVATQAKGKAWFKLSKDETSLRYKLRVRRIDNVTAAHIHCGAPGQNGAVIAFLYPTNATSSQIKPNSFKVRGVVTASGLIPRAAGSNPATECATGALSSFADLVQLLRDGNAYTNVHTTDHPGGEVRGQIRG